MPNKSNNQAAAARRRYVDDVARLLVAWGVPQTAARLYGYLLLSPDPVSLGRITADLEVSKSSASVAARLLERYQLVRRLGERGSKRVSYEVSDNYDGMLAEQDRLLDALAGLFRTGAAGLASGAAGARLEEMATFYEVMREAMADARRQWRVRSVSPRAATSSGPRARRAATAARRR